jgi:hypothetical protein
MKWSLDEKLWKDFVPSAIVTSSVDIRYRINPEYFLNRLLLDDDLKTIEKFIGDGHRPTLAANLLARAHEYQDKGHLRHSFIEGYTALELAIKEFTKSKIADNKHLGGSMSEFLNTKLKSQIVAIGTTIGTVSFPDLENTIKAIKIRNEIVHDGKEAPPGNESEVILQGLFRTISALTFGPNFKFPRLLTED